MHKNKENRSVFCRGTTMVSILLEISTLQSFLCIGLKPTNVIFVRFSRFVDKASKKIIPLLIVR